MRAWHGAIAVLFLASTTGVAQAQVRIEEENTNVGTTSAEFLTFGAGARGMALGPSFAALARDVEALYYNPAGLPLMDGPQTMLTMMPYFADTDYFWAGLAFPFGGGQYGIGLSLGNFGFSDQPVYTEEDPDGLSGRTYGVSETVVGLSFARAFIDRFTGGVTLKYISDALGQARATAFAIDIGTNFHTEFNGRPIAISFMMQNLGTSLEHSGQGLDFNAFPQPGEDEPVSNVDPSPARFQTQAFQLPVAFRVGVAYDVLSAERNRLSVLGEFSETNNNDPSWGFAGEYEWISSTGGLRLAGRASYSFQPDNYLSGQEEADFAGATNPGGKGADGLALGGGIRYQIGEYEARVDYTYRHFGVLGTIDVFTIGFAW